MLFQTPSQLDENRFAIMKVLLTYPGYDNGTVIGLDVYRPLPCLPVLDVAQYLTKSGIYNEVKDTGLAAGEKIHDYLKFETPEGDHATFDALGVYCTSPGRLFCYILISTLRKQADLKGINVFVWGPDAENYPEEYLGLGIDEVVVGESQQTITELLNTLSVPFNPFLDHVKGIKYKNALGEVHTTPEREKMASLEHLPWPARKQLDIESYLKKTKKEYGERILNIGTHYNRNGTCGELTLEAYEQEVIKKSATDFVLEMKAVWEQYRPDLFFIEDDHFAGNASWLHGFQQELERQAISIRFECMLRLSSIDSTNLELLKSMGCSKVWIVPDEGLLFDKRPRSMFEAMMECVGKIREVGMMAGLLFMIGVPGDDRVFLQNLRAMLKENMPDDLRIGIAYPLKGSVLNPNGELSASVEEGWEIRSDADTITELPNTLDSKIYESAIRNIRHDLKCFILAGAKNPAHRTFSDKVRVFTFKLSTLFGRK